MTRDEMISNIMNGRRHLTVSAGDEILSKYGLVHDGELNLELGTNDQLEAAMMDMYYEINCNLLTELYDSLSVELGRLEHICLWKEDLSPDATRTKNGVEFSLHSAIGYIEDFRRDRIHALLNGMKYRPEKD